MRRQGILAWALPTLRYWNGFAWTTQTAKPAS
jgi:hypothetical protein